MVKISRSEIRIEKQTFKPEEVSADSENSSKTDCEPVYIGTCRDEYFAMKVSKSIIVQKMNMPLRYIWSSMLEYNNVRIQMATSKVLCESLESCCH